MATTEDTELLECTNGGQYLEPQVNYVLSLTISEFSTKSYGDKFPIS